MAGQYTREVAYRIFAQEFRDSNLSFKDSNDQMTSTLRNIYLHLQVPR